VLPRQAHGGEFANFIVVSRIYGFSRGGTDEMRIGLIWLTIVTGSRCLRMR